MGFKIWKRNELNNDWFFWREKVWKRKEEEHNVTLSKQRAQAVVSYLIKKDISKERLKYKGMGSSIPINPKNKKEKQALNRRVEFRVID